MNNIRCLTKFTVYPEYNEVPVEDVSDNDLLADREHYGAGYVVQISASSNSETPTYTFNPLEDTPFLYLELAKIHSNQDLMKFVKIYGLPFDFDKNNSNEDTIHVFKMDTITFYKNLSIFKDLLNLWYSLQNNEEYSYPHSALNNIEIIRKDHVGDSIANILNKLKTCKESYEQIKDDANGEVQISHCVRFKSLLETAYFQLTRAIVNNVSLRKCNECNEIFEVAHDSQKFCPPRLGRKRSTCENTHKVRKSRQKQKGNSNQE